MLCEGYAAIIILYLGFLCLLGFLYWLLLLSSVLFLGVSLFFDFLGSMLLLDSFIGEFLIDGFHGFALGDFGVCLWLVGVDAKLIVNIHFNNRL